MTTENFNKAYILQNRVAFYELTLKYLRATGVSNILKSEALKDDLEAQANLKDSLIPIIEILLQNTKTQFESL